MEKKVSLKNNLNKTIKQIHSFLTIKHSEFKVSSATLFIHLATKLVNRKRENSIHKKFQRIISSFPYTQTIRENQSKRWESIIDHQYFPEIFPKKKFQSNLFCTNGHRRIKRRHESRISIQEARWLRAGFRADIICISRGHDLKPSHTQPASPSCLSYPQRSST